jgi:hypothetical protein
MGSYPTIAKGPKSATETPHAAPQPPSLPPSLILFHTRPLHHPPLHIQWYRDRLKSLESLLAAKHPAIPAPTGHHRRRLALLLLHRRPISHQLRAALLPLRVLNLPFSPARAPLPDAEKRKGQEGDEHRASNAGNDGHLRRVGQGLPFLAYGLAGRGVVVAVEGKGFGSAVR